MRLTILCCLLNFALSASPIQGQQDRVGQHWPAPLSTSLYRIDVSIKDGVASTEILQVIHNAGSRPLEATWLLPLPVDAIADRFTMTMGGKETSGEILPPDKARRIYERIVRSRRDPGLLEYIGKGCLRARIFPIPAKDSVQVKVRYTQVIPFNAGVYQWNFPLKATRWQGGAPKKTVLDLRIDSRVPIKNLYSPHPSLDLVRKDDHHARASMELAKTIYPRRDINLFYSVSKERVGLNLLSYRKAQDAGYFLLMLSPQAEWPQSEFASKSVQFVLDTSGSMQGEKIKQAKAALRFFVQSLNPSDKFNVIPFATEARPFFDGPQAVSESSIAKAMQNIETLVARGGTNIDDALDRALTRAVPNQQDQVADVRIVVFLTDGQPTVGATNTEDLLSALARRNTSGTRFFVFGVGNEVNTSLLDKIAVQTGGDRDYVKEEENIELKTSVLLEKLSHPVMTDLRLFIDGLETSEILPGKLPDLFKGGRIISVGRYRGHGMRAIRLRANVQGQEREFVFEGKFAENDQAQNFIPSLWAQRKIAQLLDAIRLNGALPELVQEVHRLGREHAVVTPYTSHLILEEGLRVSRARRHTPSPDHRRSFDDVFGKDSRVLARISRELYQAGAIPEDSPGSLRGSAKGANAESEESGRRLSGLGKKDSGRNAVADSLALDDFYRRSTPLSSVLPAKAKLLSQRIADRSFHLVDGIWVDSLFRPEMLGKEQRVEAFTEAYFQLLSDHPEIAPYLAFSARMILVIEGKAIELH